MSLARAADELGWPNERWILEPPGAGAAVNAALAQKKIGHTFTSLEGAQNARIGILSSDPMATETQAPLALVCAFDQPAPVKTLVELHRLAWNFCRTPLLLTVDTHGLRAFTCCESPSLEDHSDNLPSEIPEVRYEFTGRSVSSSPMVAQANQALHWLEIVSGRFIRRHEQRFRSDRRADTLLLKNLRFVRSRLHDRGLEFDVIHDLLARIIFVQFLFDRRDSDGHTALNPKHLAQLHQDGILSEPYVNFGEILSNHVDCYRLFWYLDERFNGDLFPGQGSSDGNRQRERDTESRTVQPSHLHLLSEFVAGRMELRSGQYSLWPWYSFDIIPLEFISSIYEAFVTRRTGTVYTPAYLVDFVLDGVLPWEGTEWDLKILDPACGSGIFLVKAFQRLIHRWKLAHPGQRIRSSILRALLEKNLFGVDDDAHAVRTASFSLYLAMCDEIEPRHYWTQVRFPDLRGQRLISSDFFDEDAAGLKTKSDGKSYDIVVGNAPFGQNTTTLLAKEWANQHGWPVSYGDIGPLFLAKSAALVKTVGWVSLIQPGSTLLFNTSRRARMLRDSLFRKFDVVEIVNFSALRFGLFKRATGPAVLFTLQPTPPSEGSLSYISPKPVRNSGSDDYRIVIDPYDVNRLNHKEAIGDSIIWSVLTWGGRRDLALLRRLESFPTLAKHESSGLIATRQGIIRGNRTKAQPCILDRRLLAKKDFGDDVFWFLSPYSLDLNKDALTDGKSSTDFSAFRPMQLIIKKTWTVKRNRFQAMVVDPPEDGVLCTQDYVSVHADVQDRGILHAACLSYNSKFAVYYLLLRSGRFANYRPSPYVTELLEVPIPEAGRFRLEDVRVLEDLEQCVEDSFDFKPAERVLIEDTLNYTLSDFKGDVDSPGRLSTRRAGGERRETELHSYCTWFLRVLRAGFGEKKPICATIFEETSQEYLPIRLVAIHLDWDRAVDVAVESIGSGILAKRLQRVYSLLAEDVAEGFSFRRVGRVFDIWYMEGQRIPTIVVVKPDQARYWSGSIALRDADEVSQEILQRMQTTEDTQGTEEK